MITSIASGKGGTGKTTLVASFAAMPVVEFSDGAVSDAITEIWASIQ